MLYNALLTSFSVLHFAVLPILAKFPLGLFVPRFRHELPDDFPYDPWRRDMLITSLALICRGEFNFIIAAFSLSVGLFGPQLYSAVVLAVLLASIVGPLVLARVIHYYNEKAKAYLSGSHPIKRDGRTCDGYRPLFLAIQARTPIEWGIQETFKRALEEGGLIIIDHRSWHTLGLTDARDITELFVQDTKVKVKVPGCFAASTAPNMNVDVGDEGLDRGDAAENEGSEDTSSAPSEVSWIPQDDEMGMGDENQADGGEEATLESAVCVENGIDEEDEIKKRCEEISESKCTQKLVYFFNDRVYLRTHPILLVIQSLQIVCYQKIPMIT